MTDLQDFDSGLRFSRLRSEAGFSLIEVMIAAGLFFMATFAILLLVSATLRNTRALQRCDVDAGMAACQVSQLLKTNRQIEISGSGDFGEAYPDYSFEFASGEYRSNGLLRVQIVVKRRGSISPIDTATIWVYDPDAKSPQGK
jgi:Tfp pilus assembly protein PilV